MISEPALESDITAAGEDFVNSAAVIAGTMVAARASHDRLVWVREFVRMLKQKAPVREFESAA